MTQNILTGRCLCGNITYRITLPTTETLPKVGTYLPIHQPLLYNTHSKPLCGHHPSNGKNQIILCHCTNCKRYTGSGFSANIIVPQSSFAYTQGSPKLYSDRSDKGGLVLREFCPDCGSPFTSRSEGDEGKEVAVKSGTLNDGDRVRCQELGMEIYYHRRDGWVDGMGDEEVKRVDGSMGG